jgi:hypothetical protein
MKAYGGVEMPLHVFIPSPNLGQDTGYPDWRALEIDGKLQTIHTWIIFVASYTIPEEKRSVLSKI